MRGRCLRGALVGSPRREGTAPEPGGSPGMVSRVGPGVRAITPVIPPQLPRPGCASGGCARPVPPGAGGPEDTPRGRAACGTTRAPSALGALPWKPTSQSWQTHSADIGQKKQLLPNTVNIQKQCQQCVIIDTGGSCLKKQVHHMWGMGRTGAMSSCEGVREALSLRGVTRGRRCGKVPCTDLKLLFQSVQNLL